MPFFTVSSRFIGSLLLLFSLNTAFSQTPSPTDPRDTLRILAEEEQRRIMDPALGRVPYERLEEARKQLLSRQSTGGAQTNSAIPNVTWQERGPSNVGGRTRALLFDPNDTTHKKVWAASPGGGLWYTNDITDANAGWTPVSDSWENLIVTAIAADPSNPQIMYAGTGDYYGSMTGGGIWKTTNGGTSWSRLSSTIPGGNVPAISRAFDYIQRVAVSSSGHVFVATQYGVVRSTDGGTNWSYALAPNQGIGNGSAPTNNYYNDKVTDLKIGTDGILYAAFYPSRVFRSNDAGGTAWTEITPPGISGDRTELALAPSTSGSGQVLYGVSRANNNTNYSQDIKWFKKSSNAGATWSDVTIPTTSSGSHFTSGNGYSNMTLAVHPTDPNTVYAGGSNWFSSTNSGTSWTVISGISTKCQGIWFQPGSQTAATLAGDEGVTWFADWVNIFTSPPTIAVRNNGYRVGEVSSVAMKNSPGSSFLLAGVLSNGFLQLPIAGLSAGTQFFGVSYPGTTFIDEDDATLQLFQAYGSFYRYSSSGSTQIVSLNSYYSTAAADYDSPSNTLYVADYTNNQGFLRKITNAATTPQSTTVPLTGFNTLATYLKLSPDRTSLYLGTSSGKVYKVSNLGQSTPTVTAIDNGALPPYYNVSCIDVGADENELLVTLSNYGAQSVWYTNNGGQAWIGKDQSNFGLPDMPVRTALFNPQNRKQVFLGTELGVWSTTDITATNPGWTPTTDGVGAIRINQLRYRPADGRLVAATGGRGVWQSDALAIPYTLPTLTLTGVSNATLCAGNTFTVSFTKSGPALGSNNKYEVWISDANGSFANQQRIGSGTDSPVSATLTSGYNALPYGTNYRVKVISTDPEVESNQSDALALGNLTSAMVTDRLGTNISYSTGGIICPGSRATLKTFPRNAGLNVISADSYQWQLNGSVITGSTSGTVSAQQAGTYQVTVKQVGCTVMSSTYQIASTNSPYLTVQSVTGDAPQCDDHPLTISSNYIGETATYQWTRDNSDIAGSVSNAIVVNQTGLYSYRFRDGSCSSTVAARYLQFGRSLNAVVRLSSDNDSLLCTIPPNYGLGMTADFSSSSDYTFQWYRDGVLLPGSTSNSYYAYQPGIYSVLLKQGNCQTRSNALTIRPTDQLKVSIRHSYTDQSACSGETRYLYAYSAFNSSFQWQRDGVDIAGANASQYAATLSGNYTVRIQRGNCSATSEPVSFTFGSSIHPKLSLTETCSDLSMTPDNYGNHYTISGYQFQWYKNGSLVSSTTSLSYYTSQTNRSGIYFVRVTNGSCTGLSKEVYAGDANIKTVKPVIDVYPSSRQLCAANSVRLGINSYRGNLQWKRNGITISGRTQSSFYVTEPGLYTAFVQDGSCNAESDPVEITIGEATTAKLSGNALVNSGQSVLLPITFTGLAPWSASLTTGQSVTATYQNPAYILVAPTTNTTYQLASVVNACGTGTVSGNAVVTVGSGQADVSLNMNVSSRTPKLNDIVEVFMTLNNAGPQEAVGVQAQSRLPTGMEFVDSGSPGLSFADGLVTANAGTIPVNGLATLSFRARVTQSGTLATAAQIIATQTPDPDSQPNSGTGDGQDDAAQADLRTADATGPLLASANPNQVPLPRTQSNQPASETGKADLSLSVSTDKLIVESGALVSLSLIVSNRGGTVAGNVTLQTVLPAGWQVVSTAGLVVSGQTVTGGVGPIPVGGSVVLPLVVRISSGGTVQAQIQGADLDDSDSTPGNGFDKGEDDETSVLIRVRR